MRAAVVERWDAVPRYGEFREPEAGDGECVVEVRAAALSHLVRGQASGRHYSAGKELPMVPGFDGVGTTPEGRRVYFFAPRGPWGAMAERTVVSRGMMLTVPDGVDDIAAAAMGNPGLATWGALVGRARMEPGEVVLVNGATGVTGRQAVQAAKLLGARWVIATGRDRDKLEAVRGLGADEVIVLEEGGADRLRAEFGEAIRERCVNVVLDYLWGRSAELLLEAAAGHGGARGEPRVRFVQIGAMSGGTIGLEGAWLRSSGVELLGSGLGSLGAREILEALGRMYGAAAEGRLGIETEAVPLQEVEAAWGRDTGERRLVFTV